MPGCDKPAERGSVCDACLAREQAEPGSLARTVDKEASVLRRRLVFRSIGMVALAVLFLYVVLFGAVKVIKLAGG